MKYLATLILLLIALVEMPYAQDLKSDIEKMTEHYKSNSNFHAKMDIQVFQKNTESPVFVQKIEVKNSGSNTHYRIGKLLMISNVKYTLWINHTDKEIYCKKNEKVENKSVRSFANLNIDSLFSTYAEVIYNGTRNNLKHYTVKKQNAEIEQADLYLDATSYIPRKVVYQYNPRMFGGEENTVETSFLIYNTDAKFNPSIFSEKPYLRQVGGELVVTPPYKTYRLILNKLPGEE